MTVAFPQRAILQMLSLFSGCEYGLNDAPHHLW
jgi:hypothetical protein